MSGGRAATGTYIPRVFGFRIHKSAYKRSLECRKREKEREKERRLREKERHSHGPTGTAPHEERHGPNDNEANIEEET